MLPLPVCAAQTPESAQQILDQSGISQANGLDWSFEGVWNWLLGILSQQLGQPLQFAVELVVYLAIACVVGLLASSGWKRCVDAIAVLEGQNTAETAENLSVTG